ncbi:TPA: hypothetical protein DIS57_02120 [Candidatus Wolfebacteria bacterium]|nr:hypothetical protein [Candidatus Wolfebacteria bacterium]
MNRTHYFQRGLSVLEAILASALFVLIATAVVTLLLQGLGSNRLSNEQTIANQYAAEGIEAVRNIRNRSSYAALATTTGIGVDASSGVWTLGGTDTLFDKYTRVITIADVYRDTDGNIVLSGGVFDPNTKKVISTVRWNVSLSRSYSIVLIAYLTNWRAPIVSSGGMLIYGDGGTVADTIAYRIFDGTAWGAAGTVADVSTATTNRAARAVKVYSSAETGGKVLLSRHYNGTTQYIYGQVYNATTTTWGNVQLLASWSGSTYLDVQNFDGTYLENGAFMAVYSDNSRIPKVRTWNGSAWMAQSSMTSLGAPVQIPNYIVAKARPGTNEVMAVFFTQGLDTITQYYNGTAWSAVTTHAAVAPVSTKRFVDFAWSLNVDTTGMLVYAFGVNAKALSTRVWVANGTGSGAWGATIATASQSDTVGAVSVVARAGANEFHLCNKNSASTPALICYAATFVGNTPMIVTPANNTIAAATDAGIERSYHLGFERSGSIGIGVYSDNTTVAKLKKYAPSINTWDVGATPIAAAPYTLGSIKSVRVAAASQNDDIMLLITDGNLDLYSIVWDGSDDALSTSPPGKAFVQHGLNGSAPIDLWYDFTWDSP